MIAEKLHLGRKVQRIREIKGMKQDTLANELGITHQAVSKIEQSESIDDEKLKQIATVLGVTADTIKNFNEDLAINIIANNNNGADNSAAVNFQCQFNPLDKIIELYERLLLSEREKNILLEKKLQSSLKE